MCGIFGYAGKEQAAPILLDGLSKLEYRGYDSAGICVHGKNGMQIEKVKGRLDALRNRCDDGKTIHGTVGIGHTRWATHGEPSDANSHPHLSDTGKIAVVHNGIIENEAKLRHWLASQGHTFRSQTDTEVIANLIGHYYESGIGLLQAIRQTIAQLDGSFALGILCADQPQKVVAVKKDSPLIFGWGNGAHFLSSDATAVLKYTRLVSYLDDGDMAAFDGQTVAFYDSSGEKTEKHKEMVSWEQSEAELGGYDHFMLKEIFEQPKAVRDTILPRIRDGRIFLGDLDFSTEYLRGLRKISLVGCGSAYYVSVLAKYAFEKTCRIPTEAVMASEFRYGDPIVDERDLVIAISQSGETADTLAAVKEAKKQGARILAVVNVTGSSIAKEASQILYTRAGPEIAVATTKAFSTQLVSLWILCLDFAEKLRSISCEKYEKAVEALQKLPAQMERVLSKEMMVACRHLAGYYCGQRDAFFIGRNVDSAVCMEGSLKLKEIAYMHCEAYPAGELKHGPISLVEEGMPVVALATVRALLDKTMANIREVKARGADVLCITLEGKEEEVAEVVDHVITVPSAHPLTQPELSLLPLQLFAYYVAVQRGCDVDKPRNLAKSVTVE